ncbi:UDP-N-acetylmuramate--L-alanine ligase, partial [Candidatus Bipolaricaulota bacterium]|nr:UDP-N-acetylmuramate--L-alanine ligase [Candidatus Bipolaricaulota bacterium]
MINAGKRYHFIGIGGSGMSSLATVMLAGGSKIFGSDLRENAETLRLRRKGATIHLGHDERFLDEEGIDEVIVSSAIGTENVELQAAMRNKLPVVRRLHALATLLHGYTSIGIAGTHGKTTTTAMVATILRQAGKDPSYLVGAHCAGLGGNAHLGNGGLFVTEVDESDGLFLALHPAIGVLNNIGRDHLDTYRSLDGIVQSFTKYIRQSERAVLAIDDENVRVLAESFPDALTVGLSPLADLQARNIRHHHFHTTFELVYQGEEIGPV